MDVNEIFLMLYNIQAVKFGDFMLKSGIRSPIYVDLRATMSHPTLLMAVAKRMWQLVLDCKVDVDVICGVPYGAVPLATCLSVVSELPMLFHRKEVKDHGTKKLVEGNLNSDQKCMVVEDVLVSGMSIMETVKALRALDIQVTDAVVFLNREQGGVALLQKEGVKVHNAATLTQMLDFLHENEKISTTLMDETKLFIRKNQLTVLKSSASAIKRQVLTYKARYDLCKHPVLKRLYKIMNEKRTNLALSVDTVVCDEVLNVAQTLGPYLCILKTHVDILTDFSWGFVEKLQQLSREHNFLIFEDRKFADIGNTVKLQYTEGLYKMSDWAHIINAHPLPGPSIVHGLKQAGIAKGNACLLIAEMSTNENLYTPEYMKKTAKMADDNKDFVIGFICQSRISDDPCFIHMVPGVKIERGEDGLGQSYKTPEETFEKGADIIIVGRGILNSKDPIKAAVAYRDAGYNAYLATL